MFDFQSTTSSTLELAFTSTHELGIGQFAELSFIKNKIEALPLPSPPIVIEKPYPDHDYIKFHFQDDDELSNLSVNELLQYISYLRNEKGQLTNRVSDLEATVSGLKSDNRHYRAELKKTTKQVKYFRASLKEFREGKMPNHLKNSITRKTIW